MPDAYDAWIEAHVPDFSAAYGKCASVTEHMAAAFPELRRVRGHYYDFGWGERAHWWLVTADGRIVDPTAKQFPSRGQGHYEEWREGMPLQTGICMDCGDPVYDGATFCSPECEAATCRYLGIGPGGVVGGSLSDDR
jgi:hypothetical protein